MCIAMRISILLRLFVRLAVLAPALVLAVEALCPTVVFAQATLENPRSGSFQSGVAAISGWACDANEILIELNGVPYRAGYPTTRPDTLGRCGDTDNGFSLLWNWNNLGAGRHTVRALLDGVEFANTTVHVTTFGEDPFPRGWSGTFNLPDFPTSGETTIVRWEESLQKFVITDGQPPTGGGYNQVAGVSAVLENPSLGSAQSGVGVISGWACEAQNIVIELNGEPYRAGYPTTRPDTLGRCGDTNNGFSLLWNWNNLGAGTHTVRALIDGQEFATATVWVTTFGEDPFPRGWSGTFDLSDFPTSGETAVVQWEESLQNFVISAALPTRQLMAVHPVVALPADVQIPNVAVRSVYAETAEVLASPKPSLLLAEDTEGTVLLGVANRDGGVLGERDGRVEVSVDSTAVMLVALRAGYAVHEIDQEVVAAIQGHAEYADLTVTLAALVEADKNFLDTLIYHPDVVATIETISGIFGANGPHSRRGLSLRYSLAGVASAREGGPTPLSPSVTGKTDADDCAHRAALWSLAEGADLAAMFAPVGSVAAALRRAATAAQSPPPPDQSDPQDTEELSLSEIMKFFTDLTAAQHAGPGPPAPETQPAGEGECNAPTAPGDGGGEWWELAMRGYMDHRGTGGAGQENPFRACLPPDPPTNLRITEVGADFLDLEWDPLPEGGGEGYTVLQHYAFDQGLRSLPKALGTVETTRVRVRGIGAGDVCFTVRAVSRLWTEDSGDAAYRGEDVWAGAVCIHDSNIRSAFSPDREGGWCRLIGIGTMQSDGRPYRSHQCINKPLEEPCSATDFDEESGAEITRIIVASGLTTRERCLSSRPPFDRYTLEPVPQPDGPSEEAELCEVIHTYREEGCKGERECIKREIVWEPCKEASTVQILQARFRQYAKKLFEYFCEKECTPDGEVRCKVREERGTHFGIRG